MIEHRRTSSYTYGPSREGAAEQQQQQQQHQPQQPQHTSSAFSASAQPNEDWTKISDLAERRRIQNRIAQRNYRKKLKKRLEDLERKAASTSASPEQTPAVLPVKVDKSKAKPSSPKRRSSSSRQHPSSSSTHISTGGAPTAEDWSMFSNQYTRQLSTSPPPFVFPALDSFPTPPSPQLPAGGFSCQPGVAIDYSLDSNYQYQPYLQPFDPSLQFHWQDKTLPVKQESIFDNSMSMTGYPPLGPVDMSFSSTHLSDASYQDTTFPEASLTPELCDIYEHSSAGSPGDFNTFPQTPMMMSLSPPFGTGFDM